MFQWVRNFTWILMVSSLTACETIKSKDTEPFPYYLSGDPNLPGKSSVNINPCEDNTDPCEDWNNHVLAINRRGDFKPIKFNNSQCCTKNDKRACAKQDNKLTEEEDNKLKQDEHIQKIIDAFKNSGKPRLLVFIHGGMNKYDTSVTRVAEDLPRILRERPNEYPVFIIWPSDMWDTYGDSISHNYQGIWDHVGYSLSVPFKFLTDVAEVGVKSLLSYGKQSYLGIGSRCYSEYWREKIPLYCKSWSSQPDEERDRNPSHDPCQDKSPRNGFICVPSDEETAKQYDLSVGKLAGFVLVPLKLISIPVVDSLGHRDWYSQKSRTLFTMHKPCQDDAWGKGSCEDGVVKAFFFQLKDKLKTDTIPRDITLIGHSMGAIVASDIIGQFPTLPYKNVVFMGGAVSIRDFQNTVLSVERQRIELLLSEDKNRSATVSAPCSLEELNKPPVADAARRPFCFFNLSLHPYAEATEETLYGAAPSGSLLEWIDANFEDPGDLSDRTIGRWANIVPLSRYFEKDLVVTKELPGTKDEAVTMKLLGTYVFFKRFGLGLRDPHSHGDLANAKEGLYWQPSYWQ